MFILGLPYSKLDFLLTSGCTFIILSGNLLEVFMKSFVKLIFIYLLFVNAANASGWVDDDGKLLVSYERSLLNVGRDSDNSNVLKVNSLDIETIIVSVNGEFTKPFMCRRKCDIEFSKMSGFSFDKKNLVEIMIFKKEYD